MHTVPFFSPPTSDIRPIIIAHVAGYHYVSLEVSLNPSLPIPHPNPEWYSLHDQSAQGWDGIYCPNVEVFRKLAKASRRARNEEWAQSRAGLPEPDAISLVSEEPQEGNESDNHRDNEKENDETAKSSPLSSPRS
ncbi:uncharacterized protein MELLADRAFT_68100 [Melampsora larici-populina 98AG31]|uniref:Uncharacterized protein n=1 Tax=Melampsora larici-populina (strain 98AG31 / pathotype 3-4-7) TaxID=747676 RepID=F4RUN3_MELLP|nr:uncharacterized protein MELLADRAFT_65261 [Melampsora larici-populina 98AG31]XP_007416642.1 uncharacterized protein MELLADRAFT_68100 [Melampsora larici-populina 98AG31]EGG00044.1 hypothetical protein MELLADRAFT_68100 [Melampsora larici-populina 98AG31]EGG03962.1 hypothetical protein MELLADRAFT_65261 [Melampsora larici-populina 98AG31]